MKQLEVTVKVFNTLDEINNILSRQGFNVIRKSRVEDKYLSQKEIKENNIYDVLSSCVLLRYLNANGEVFTKITYKNKEYTGDNVLTETKINVNIDSISNANKLFDALGFKHIVDVNYDVIVYEKDGFELAFQNVERLGLLLEVESNKDFTDSSEEDILSAKKTLADNIRTLGLNISDDYDIKKAYELIKLNIK